LRGRSRRGVKMFSPTEVFSDIRKAACACRYCSRVSRPRWQPGLGQRPNSSSRERQKVQCVASHQTKYVIAPAAANSMLSGNRGRRSPRLIVAAVYHPAYGMQKSWDGRNPSAGSGRSSQG
jgi:hypothetical protein